MDDPWDDQDNWLLPFCLASHLESLSIHRDCRPRSWADSSNNNNFHDSHQYKLLTFALQLRHLKKLTLSGISLNYDRLIEGLTARYTKRGVTGVDWGLKLRFKPLQELILEGTNSEGSIVYMGSKVWPGLKSLKVTIRRISDLPRNFFTVWKDLERLELNFKEFQYDYDHDLHEFLTGVKCPVYYQSGRVLVTGLETNGGVLRDLQRKNK